MNVSSLKLFLPLTLLLFPLISPLLALHTVYDPSVVAEMGRQLSQGREVLGQNQLMNKQMNQLNKLIGLNQTGDLSSFLKILQGESELFKEFESTFLKTSYLEGSDFKNNSYGEGKKFWTSAFFPKTSEMTVSQQREYGDQRKHLLKESIVHAMSLATQQKQSLQNHQQNLLELSKRAAGSENLHEDLKTTNQLLVLLATELNHLRALQAANLEIEALKALQHQPIVFR